MDGCVRLGAVLPPVFICSENSDAACDRSRRARPVGAALPQPEEDSAQKEGGGERQTAGVRRLSRLFRFSLRPRAFSEAPYPSLICLPHPVLLTP